MNQQEHTTLPSDVADEAAYHLEVDYNDDDNIETSAVCCAERRQRIVASELWLEIKDLASELLEFVKYRCWKKKLLSVLLVISFCLVFYDLLFGKYIFTWLTEYVKWMKVNPIAGIFAYIGIFVLATVRKILELSKY